MFRRRVPPHRPTAPGGVLVVTAMRRELAGVPVRGRTRSFLLRRQRRGEWRPAGGDEMDVDYHAGYGGVGADFAGETTALGIAEFRPRLVVSAGYAGGLDPQLSLLDVVTADAVLAPDGTRYPAEPLGSSAVTVATADAVVATPAEKAALFAATGAAVVDMEAAGVAAACTAAGVRFAAVKVVTDAADRALPTDLEPFFALDRGGRPRGGRRGPDGVRQAAGGRPGPVAARGLGEGLLARVGRTTERRTPPAPHGGLTPPRSPFPFHLFPLRPCTPGDFPNSPTSRPATRTSN